MKTAMLLSAFMLCAECAEDSLLAPIDELEVPRNRRGGSIARTVNAKNKEAGTTNKQLGVPNERPYWNQLLKRASCQSHGMVKDAARAIKNGADLERTGNNGWTPLVCAAMRNNNAVAKLLLKNGADVNHASSKRGRTPLFWAVGRKNQGMAKMLMSFGADPTIPDVNGDTPLSKAGPLMLKIIDPANQVAPPQTPTGSLVGDGDYDDYYTGYENYNDNDYTLTPPNEYDDYYYYEPVDVVPQGEQPLGGVGNGEIRDNVRNTMGNGEIRDNVDNVRDTMGNGEIRDNVGDGQVRDTVNTVRDSRSSDTTDDASAKTVEAEPAAESSGNDNMLIIILASVGGVIILLLLAVICMKRGGKKKEPKPRRLRSSDKKRSKKNSSKKPQSERAQPFMNNQAGGYQEYPQGGIAPHGTAPGRGLDIDYNQGGNQWYSDNPSDDAPYHGVNGHRGHENYAPGPTQMRH